METTHQNVTVFVDDREPDGAVDAALSGLPGVRCVRRRLSAGDYAIGPDTVRVERKTWADFAASLADGRLFSQAFRLQQATAGCGVPIVEGDPAAAAAVHREALQGALIALALRFGLLVLRARDPAETARLLLYIARQVHRAGGPPPPRRVLRRDVPRRRRLAVLTALPGVGPGRAAALLDALGSVVAVARADPRALARVPGIGPTTARRIAEILQGGATPTTQDNG